MDLILWRHADAENGEVDLARELSLRGHKQAERMGRWLSKRLAEGTRIYGRGASDMKSSVGVMMVMLELFRDADLKGALQAHIVSVEA